MMLFVLIWIAGFIWFVADFYNYLYDPVAFHRRNMKRSGPVVFLEILILVYVLGAPFYLLVLALAKVVGLA